MSDGAYCYEPAPAGVMPRIHPSDCYLWLLYLARLKFPHSAVGCFSSLAERSNGDAL